MKISEATSLKADPFFNQGQLKADLKKKAIRGAGATVFSQVAVYGIQMIGTVILARLLSPDDFGLVAMVTVFSILLQNFGMRGFTEATMQSEEIDRSKISTLFWIHVAISTALLTLFISLSPLIAWFYNEPRLKLIVIIISLNFIFNALSTQHLALLRRNLQFYRVSANEIIAAISSVIIAILLASQGWGYWALVARRMTLIAATTVGAWILCRWFPSLPAFGTGVKEMLKFGINTYGNFVMNYFSRNLDKILIGWKHGAQSLGNYERAYYLFVMPVNQSSYPLTSVAVAALSRLRDDPEKFSNYYLKALSVLSLLGMLLSAVLTLIGKDFILLLLGSQWTKAGEIFTVFGPAVGILLVYGTHGWLHLSLGNADKWFRWGLLELLISFLAFLIGLPFGALGVAIAYTLSFYILIGPGLWYAGRPIKISFLTIVRVIWKHYLSGFLAFAFSWIIFYHVEFSYEIFIKMHVLSRISVASVFCTILYFLFMFILYRSFSPMLDLFAVFMDMLPFSPSRNQHSNHK